VVPDASAQHETPRPDAYEADAVAAGAAWAYAGGCEPCQVRACRFDGARRRGGEGER
jgi:hypothetical protein